jgi:hypothetical protein
VTHPPFGQQWPPQQPPAPGGPGRSNHLPWIIGGVALFAFVCLGAAVAGFIGLRTWGTSAETSAVPQVSRAVAAGDSDSWPELPTLPAGTEPSLQSTAHGAPTQIAFVNKRSVPVTVSWLNGEGKLVEYRTLGGGEQYVQQTYVGHLWVVSNVGGPAIVAFQPDEAPGRAVIR